MADISSVHPGGDYSASRRRSQTKRETRGEILVEGKDNHRLALEDPELTKSCDDNADKGQSLKGA